jgi:hypothetical protein
MPVGFLWQPRDEKVSLDTRCQLECPGWSQTSEPGTKVVFIAGCGGEDRTLRNPVITLVDPIARQVHRAEAPECHGLRSGNGTELE